MNDLETTTLSMTEIENLALAAMKTGGASDMAAAAVSHAVALAERDGLPRFGLASLHARLEQMKLGRVEGGAVPGVQETGPSSILADARDGFTEPAAAEGIKRLTKLATETGVGVMTIANAWNPGVLGHYVEQMALDGLVALACANTPRAVAPAGGARALFGANPVAFAAPRRAEPPFVIDQAMAMMTRQDVFELAERRQPLPGGVGIDKEGRATTDPVSVLDGGSILSIGGDGARPHKATNLMIMVELLAGALSGANLSHLANGYEAPEGSPPRTGLFFLGLDAAYFAGADFVYRVDELMGELKNDPAIRLSGSERLSAREKAMKNGVAVDAVLVAALRAFIADGQDGEAAGREA